VGTGWSGLVLPGLLVLGEFSETLPMPCALPGGGSVRMVCSRCVKGLESPREHYFSLLGLMLLSFPHKNVKVNVNILYLFYIDLCQNLLNPFRGTFTNLCSLKGSRVGAPLPEC